MSARILFVGDMHLGRRPASLPDNLAEYDVSTAELTPAAAWRRVVRYAVEARVDAVVLAGDVVEADNARFEAYGQLHDGVGFLVERGIPVYAVSGNHDVEALPRLADAIPGFSLLGRGGRWETVAVCRGGELVVHLAGWSFPAAQYATSPLDQEDLPLEKEAGLPLLGVLHCDLLAAESPYAPVARSELERSVMDAWLLGHIHQPSPLCAGRPIGYLGSVVGLDPSETGPRGPWLVRAGAGEPVEVEQLSLSPLRWEVVQVDVSALERAEDAFAAIRDAVERLHHDSVAAHPETRAVGCRVRLTGNPPCHRELRRHVDSRELENLRIRFDEVLYFVHDVVDESRPRLDYHALAGEDHPPALLARRLIELEQGGEQARALIQQARRELMRVADDRTWAQLDALELDDETVRRLLYEAGVRALEELLEQAAERSV